MLLENCPVSSALRVVGGKWKPLVLNALKAGPLHYGQIRRRVPEASQKVLTEQLRQLAACGVVERAVISGRVVRTEYRLSAYGQTLRPILAVLAAWGATHRRRGPPAP